MNFDRDLVAQNPLDRRTANNFHRNGFANGVIIFFFPSLFSFISLRVARREETTAKVESICGVISSGTPNHNPRGRNISS